MRVIIEAEAEDDYEQITRLHTLAFKGDREARLVEQLRKTPKYVPELSLVAKYKNAVIGHVLFYPIRVNAHGGRECASLALAPVSVIPDFQNRKVGTRLIEEGLGRARKLGFKSVIVVGHSEYYPRFGFKRASEYGISAPFEVPDNCLFAIELEKGALENCRGKIEYPHEFDEA